MLDMNAVSTSALAPASNTEDYDCTKAKYGRRNAKTIEATLTRNTKQVSVEPAAAASSIPNKSDDGTTTNATTTNVTTTSGCKRVRVVSFGKVPVQTIIPIEHVNEIPKRDISKRWFCQDDFVDMQKQNRVVVQLMEMGYTDKYFVHSQRSDELTTRGLERQTAKGKASFLKDCKSSVHVVLEQQQLYQECMFPKQVVDERIAKAYQCETAKAQQVAVLQALSDFEEIRDYCTDGSCDIESIRQAQLQQERRASSSVWRKQQQAAQLQIQNVSSSIWKRLSLVHTSTKTSSPRGTMPPR